MEFDAFDAGIELGGLRNRDDIRLLVCYLLKSIDAPMTRQMLNDAMQEDGLANFFEVGQAIEELLAEGFEPACDVYLATAVDEEISGYYLYSFDNDSLTLTFTSQNATPGMGAILRKDEEKSYIEFDAEIY